MTADSWLVSSSGNSAAPRYCRDHGFQCRTSLIFFQALFSRLLKGATSRRFCCLRSHPELKSLLSAFIPSTKSSSKTMRKISDECYQAGLTIVFWGVIFEGTTSKLEAIGPIFFRFQSISILAIRSNRGKETVSVP